MSHDKTVNYVSLSNDGNILLTGSDDRTTKISYLDTGIELNFIKSFNPSLRSIRKVSFNQRNDKILTLFNRHVYIFSTQNLETPIFSLTANDWIPSASFAGRDRYLIVGSADKTAKIFSLDTGAVLAEVPSQGWVWSVDLTADGRYFAVLSDDNKLTIFRTRLDQSDQIRGLEEYYSLDLPTTGEFMGFSPDSKFLAVSLWSGESFIIDLEQKFRSTLYCSKVGYASQPVFSPDSQYLAVGQNNDGYLYRVADRKPVQHLSHDDRVTSLGFENNSIWSGSWDGTVKKTQIDTSGKVSCR